jgi:hypothetical protein
MSTLYQNPALPQQPTDEDLAAFTRPVAEIDMSQQAAPVAQPRAAKGLSFDWSVLNAQTQEEYDAKPPAIRQLIHEIQTQGILPSQEAAATRVMEIQKMLDEQASPKAQAEASAAQLSARKTQLDIGKLEQETIAKAKEQAELNTRKQLVLEKINKYTNPKAPNFTDISPLVGKFDGTAGAMLDAGGANDQRAAQRAELERLVNNDVLELTKFLKPVSQDELKFLKSMSPRLHQNDTIWREYLLDAKSRIEGMGGSTSVQQTAAPQAPQAAPAQPQQPATRVIRGQTFVQQPNGNWIPR